MTPGTFLAGRVNRHSGTVPLASPIRSVVALLHGDRITCGRLSHVGPAPLVSICRALVASGRRDCAVQVLHREDRSPAALVLSFVACAALGGP
jgi:hypothetical protein